MNRLKTFFQMTVLGGLTVILPVAILAAVLGWLSQKVLDLLSPLSGFIGEKVSVPGWTAPLLAVLLLVGLCFAVGLLIKTRIGRWVHGLIEEKVLKSAPGYNLIRETTLQLLGGGKAPFSQVALARIFPGEALVTAFVTDDRHKERVSVFVPTGPNPTSGFVYHISRKNVYPVAVPVETAMRSVISCGAGSHALLDKAAF